MKPAMQNFEQQTIPAIQQSMTDQGAGSSSALNQALASSASNLQTDLYGKFAEQQQSGQQNFMTMIMQLMQNPQFEAMVRQSEGVLPGVLKAGGDVAVGAGTAFAASSKEVKENIRDYGKGLEIVSNLEVKIYDYIESLGGHTDKVGVIAENVPEEIQVDVDGINGVDLYGLIGLLINSVKELNDKIVQLESK